MKKTVVFDLDGVIHSYKSGWKGIDIIPDEPVEGIREAIFDIRQAGYEVAVVSTRCAKPYGKEAVREYLAKNEIEVDMICEEKPPAIVYIDDRAICFDGDSSTLLEKIEAFEPWYKKGCSANYAYATPWISTSDRLPEPGVKVVARTDSWLIGSEYFIGYISEQPHCKGLWCSGGKVLTQKIAHWMPIP